MKLVLHLGRTDLEFEGASAKDIIRATSFWQELPDMCPICQAGISLTFRSPQGNDYYGMRCFGQVPHEVNFHQHKEGGGLYYVADEWKVAYGYDAETGERKGGSSQSQSRTESPQERPQSAAPADDPFARRPAPQGVATGSAGPITTATLDTLKAIATKRSDLDFQEIANKLYQRNVQDLTEGQGVAMMKYVEML